MATLSNKYQIEQRYINKGNARKGYTIPKVRFLVAHETANAKADADDHFSYFNNHQPSASAHTFIDDKKILEIIPLWEKAWHVHYDKPLDNQLFGDDANDVAIGVELCRTGHFSQAYDRYVWYFAYLCRKFALDPKKHIVAHSKLDPQRRSDPESWLLPNGVTWDNFITHVTNYYQRWNEKIVQAAVKKEEDEMLEKAIVIGGFPDMTFAEVLAARLKAPIYTRAALPAGKVAKELYVVGGSTQGLQADKVISLSGNDRFEVAAAVNSFLK